MSIHPDTDEHVAQCGVCQLRLAHETGDVDLGRVWHAVAAEVWAREMSPVERFAGRVLRSPGLARALVTTPSLLLSWIIASVVLLAIGVLATAGSGEPVGCAAGAGTGWRGCRLCLRAGDRPGLRAEPDDGRLRPHGPAGAGAGSVWPERDHRPGGHPGGGAGGAVTFGWLLPMTAVAALGLAGATVSRSANVGVGVALAGWGMRRPGQRLRHP